MVSNEICSPGAFSKIVIEFLLNCHDFKVDTSQRVSNTHRREQLPDICLKWLSAHWVYNLFASFPRWWLRCTQCTALSWQAVHLAACLCMTQHSPVHHTLLSYHLPLYLIILYCTWQPSSALHDTCRCACYLLVYLTLHVYLWLVFYHLVLALVAWHSAWHLHSILYLTYFSFALSTGYCTTCT